MRKGHRQRGGYLSEAIGSADHPGRWANELRSVYSDGVIAVKALDKAMTHVINSKIYFEIAAKGSPEGTVADDDIAVLRLFKESDAEITQTREIVAEFVRKTGDMLIEVFPIEAEGYHATAKKALGKASRTDTTTPKGSWNKALEAAYDSVIAAASQVKNRAIPGLEQAQLDVAHANERGGWDPNLLLDIKNLGVETGTIEGLRDLRDAHERLSEVAKKMAKELKKHGVKDFEKKHDYNLRHFLK
jgi:hypothetical protein